MRRKIVQSEILINWFCIAPFIRIVLRCGDLSVTLNIIRSCVLNVKFELEVCDCTILYVILVPTVQYSALPGIQLQSLVLITFNVKHTRTERRHRNDILYTISVYFPYTPADKKIDFYFEMKHPRYPEAIEMISSCEKAKQTVF